VIEDERAVIDERDDEIEDRRLYDRFPDVRAFSRGAVPASAKCRRDDGADSEAGQVEGGERALILRSGASDSRISSSGLLVWKSFDATNVLRFLRCESESARIVGIRCAAPSILCFKTEP
jgi:hypothetical protein